MKFTKPNIKISKSNDDSDDDDLDGVKEEQESSRFLLGNRSRKEGMAKYIIATRHFFWARSEWGKNRALSCQLGLCWLRFQMNRNSNSLIVFGFFLESIPEPLAKRIVKWIEKESFFDSLFLLSEIGKKNRDSQLLILRNRHSTRVMTRVIKPRCSSRGFQILATRDGIRFLKNRFYPVFRAR